MVNEQKASRIFEGQRKRCLRSLLRIKSDGFKSLNEGDEGGVETSRVEGLQATNVVYGAKIKTC